MNAINTMNTKNNTAMTFANTINDLRERRARKWEQAKNFLETHRTSDGLLKAADVAEYEKMEADIVALGNEIKRMERGEQIEAEMSRPVGMPLTNMPGAAAGIKTGRASDEYKSAMLNALRSNFRKVSNVLMEGTDASGGFLVPAEYDSRLIQTLEQENVLRRLGTVIATSGERKINVASGKPAASWVEENGELVFGDAAFDQVILDAYKLSVAVKVSEELLADNAYDLESFLIHSFGQAIANAEEEAFIIGDGISKPTGILHPTKGGQTSITTAGDTITADEVIDLVYKQAQASVSHQRGIPDGRLHPRRCSQAEGRGRTVPVAACADCRRAGSSAGLPCVYQCLCSCHCCRTAGDGIW